MPTLAQGPGWVKTALLAFLFFLLFQFAWTGAGKISSIYQQYREFQEWRQKIMPPNPFDGDGNREGIRDFIKRHFPRGANRTESEEAARIFADAADRVESGELINEDDLFGYLAENLRPVCLSAGWPDFLDELWARAAQASIGSQPSAVASALREIAESLRAKRSLFAVERLADPEEPDARIETEEPDNQDAQRDTANAPSNISEERTRARELPANYGGLYWW